MFYPKVVFGKMQLSREVDWIYGFLFFNKWGWGKYILRKHPKLKKIYIIKGRKERLRFLKKYIVSFSKNHAKELILASQRYGAAWGAVEEDYFAALSGIMETGWPKNRKKIRALISINPICPRFLHEWGFSMFFKYKKTSHALEVIMHETCHFLYFKKWSEVFRGAQKKTFESPYIEWHLSELAAPIILNDPRIQKMLKIKASFYEEHKKIKIGNKTAPEYFAVIYRRYAGRAGGFELFLKHSYKIIKKHKNLFLNLSK